MFWQKCLAPTHVVSLVLLSCTEEFIQSQRNGMSEPTNENGASFGNNGLGESNEANFLLVLVQKYVEIHMAS